MKCTLIFIFAIFAFVSCSFAADADAEADPKAVCLLAKEVGPCRKADLSFYYNSAEKACQEFFYGGCQGNENRFVTKEACEKKCL